MARETACAVLREWPRPPAPNALSPGIARQEAQTAAAGDFFNKICIFPRACESVKQAAQVLLREA